MLRSFEGNLTSRRVGGCDAGHHVPPTDVYLLDTNVVSEWTKPRPNAGIIEWLAQVEEDEVFPESGAPGMSILARQDPDASAIESPGTRSDLAL